MESKLRSKLVHVDIAEKGAGLFVATSPDVKGLLVADTSLSAVFDAIPGAISDLYAVCGEAIVVIPVEDQDGSVSSWIKMPAKLAQSALDAAMDRQTV